MTDKIRTLAIEGMLIVVSILVAFAIDAWWDERQERTQERRILESLLVEFRDNVEMLPFYRDGLKEGAVAGRELLAAMREAGPGGQVRMSPRTVGWVISHMSADPQTSTLSAVLQSGELRFITNSDIRKKLVNWPRIVADTVENDIMLRETWEPPMLDALSRAGEISSVLDVSDECWFDDSGADCPTVPVVLEYDQRVLGLLIPVIGFSEEGARELDGLIRETAAIADLIEQELASRKF